MSLRSQVSRFFKQKMGGYNGQARFLRKTDGAEVWGYAAHTQWATNPFISENILVGAASADIKLGDGDLIYDRQTGKYFYLVGLQEHQVSGVTVRYDFQVFVCNGKILVKRWNPGVLDAFTHEDSSGAYQNVGLSTYALVSNERFLNDKATYSEEDTSFYFIFHNMTLIADGDLIVMDNGFLDANDQVPFKRNFIAKVNDKHMFSGGLVRSFCYENL